MRVLVACVIVISTALGLAGCFHHQQAVVQEPLPPEHRLWRLPNVIMSPHSAAFGRDYWRPAVDLFLDNFRRYVRGEPQLNVVDKEHGY